MYTALYRKLRPRAFSDVVGQQHIVRTLTNQIIHNRISHAYLFCGVRGTGKTSCAKIFARAVNCIAPQNGEACGTCSPCNDILRGLSMDVIEIDAASNNGVDNIRDLREEVRYPPSGKYKVYIIDEVHMLSGGAFNALLKTLEEPPPQVIFILATTDPQKIPATIHSRLMRFDFHRISQREMCDALQGYVNEEGIDIAGDALEYVVRIADGSMRDALSLLDRLAGLYFNEQITLDGALDVTGSMSTVFFWQLYDALAGGKAALILDIIEEISARGRDFAQFADEFLGYLRNIMLENPTEVLPLIAHFAQVSKNVKQAGSNARLALEIGCIGWTVGGDNAVGMRDAALGIPYEISPQPVGADVPSRPQPDLQTPEPKVIPPQPETANSPENWADFVGSLEPFLSSFVKQARLGDLQDDKVYLVCEDGNTGLQGQLVRKQNILAEKLGKEMVITTASEFNNLYVNKFGKEQEADPVVDKLRDVIDFDIVVK
ncbi:MAG: DNA polymerase III subunit gamma/tau [Defluviitaleaceae bacterium]|nr:DNA polymerase III subunit gamma/tau [Defluviitaleaceae bacterium]